METGATSTTARLEAFSDGVIAIAITLLILEVKIPKVADGKLGHALLDQWPSYAAYVLTFVFIGIMWINHHRIFEQIVRVDRGLMFINLMMRMGIAFLPFPTALLAEYAVDAGTNSHVAAAVYSATMVFIGINFVGVWIYLRGHRELLPPDFDAEIITLSIRRSGVGPIIYALSIPLAFISSEACLVLYALVAAYFAFGGAPAKQLHA
jgi:Predicted integral membrane protein